MTLLRHGTRFVRWRPDKAPKQCTFEQIAHTEGSVLTLLTVAAAKPRPAAKRPPARAGGRVRTKTGATS